MSDNAYGFPFSPYEVQKELMDAIQDTLELSNRDYEGEESPRGVVGLFESPTGTGKSLSLICSVLHWLLTEDKENSEENGCVPHGDAEEFDWVKEFEVKYQTEIKSQKDRMRKIIRRHSKRFQENGDLDERKQALKRLSEVEKSNVKISRLDTILSDLKSKDQGFDWEGLIMDKDTRDEVAGNQAGEIGKVQLIYCSRTHSQISQFVNEIKKTIYKDQVSCITLGSRLNLCINESVRKLKSNVRMSERCLDLMSTKQVADDCSELNEMNDKKRSRSGEKILGKTCKSKSCSFFPTSGEKSTAQLISDTLLSNIHDIEDSFRIGKRLGVCPYYGSRIAAANADIIAVPYTSVVSEQSRQSLGIDLRGNIIVIDEAHNILESISDSGSSVLSVKQCSVAHSQLQNYWERYCSRLKSTNTIPIKQLLYIMKKFNSFFDESGWSKMFERTFAEKGHDRELSFFISLNEFLTTLKIDNINFFKLSRAIDEMELSRKLRGFLQSASKAAVNEHDADPTELDFNGFQRFRDFINSFQKSDNDGKFLIRIDTNNRESSFVKFVFLNTASEFSKMISEARAILLAGGTMQPFEFYENQLFSSYKKLASELGNSSGEMPYVKKFTCDHVIPATNLLCRALPSGPSGKELKFTFSHQNDENQLLEIGRILSNISNVVPGGIVCFFQSFQLLNNSVTSWKSHLSPVESLYTIIDRKKKIFLEPKSSKEVEEVLNEYSNVITNSSLCGGKGGSILLCVVNGKMSEGINFNDDMARCVLMIGLPYPNIKDPELLEKSLASVQMCNKNDGSKTSTVQSKYFETLCMRALNQSIGRAIRHRDDFATILLVDHRFTSEKILQQLPNWIQKSTGIAKNFPSAYKEVSQFFKSRKASSELSLSDCNCE